MVLIMAPQGNATSSCAGLEQYNAGRGRMTDEFMLINSILFYVFLVVFILTYAVWFYYRNETRLRSRGHMVSFVTGFNCLLAWVVISLRRTPPFEDEQGHSNMLCMTHAWLVISLAPLQTGSSLARLIKLLHSARYARGARHVDQIVKRRTQPAGAQSPESPPHDDGNGDTHSEAPSSVLSSRTKLNLEAVGSVKRSLTILAMSFGYGKKAKRLDRRVSWTELMNAAERRDNEEALLYSREAVTEGGAALLIFVFYIPVLATLAILVGTSDVYLANCEACDTFGQELILMAVPYGLLLAFRFRVAFLVKDEPDPDGVLKEMKIGAVVVITSILVSVILYAVDPGMQDYYYQVSYEWCFGFGLTLYWLGSVNLQLYWAILDRRARMAESKIQNQVVPRDITHLDVALRDEKIFEAFEKFAEVNFCTESVRFISDVWAWKEQFAAKSERWRMVKAQAIVTMYIVSGSVLQINIDGKGRESIEDAWKTIKTEGKTLSADLFDNAEKEILLVLKWNLWNKFIKTGALDDVVNSSPKQVSSNKSTVLAISNSVARGSGSRE